MKPMLTLDLSKTIVDLQKSVKPKQDAPAVKQAKAEVAFASLGDASRLSMLPDIITDEFVTLYSDTVEEVLLPYVQAKLISIRYASEYRQALLENIFGSENHLGIFHYLKEKNLSVASDKDIVHQAEVMILKGWQIRREGHQFWLVNGDLTRIMDMTGRAPMFKEIAMLSFDESSAHIFLDESVASKISAVAKTLGHDADALAASGNLDLLLARITDNKFAGYVVNYNALRRILRKASRFNTLVDGMNMMDLYREGYRIDSQMTFPFSEKVILSKGDDKFIMRAVTDDTNRQFLINKYLLSSIAARVKSELFAGTGVVSPEIIEIKEIRNTFALMTPMYPYEYLTHSGADNLDILQNIKIHKRGSTYVDRVFQNVAMFAIVEGILLGNKHVSPASFIIDSVSGKIFCHHSLDNFTRPLDEGIPDSAQEMDKFDVMSNLHLDTQSTVSALVKALPESFLNKLATYELNPTDYPYEFAGIREYFSSAKARILGG
jgi:hypothetical protein